MPKVLHSGSLVLVVSVLVAVGFVQHAGALPSPDFGVRANISPARSDVTSEANRLRNELNDITDTRITLRSGTPMLEQLATAIASIGLKFQTSGLNLTQQLQVLARSNGPSIADAFTPVYETIQTLHDLTINGLTAEMMSIGQLITASVTQKFNQVFGELRKSLNYLTATLQTLEADVQRARAVAGNSATISDTIVRNNVPAKTQSDVAKALIGLRLQVDVVRYMVRSTLLYLKEADDFLRDVVREVDSFRSMLSTSLAGFTRNMNMLKRSTIQYATRSFGCTLAEQNATLVQLLPGLSQIANYTTTLQQPLEALLTRLTADYLSSGLNDFDQQFSSYLTAAVSIAGAQDSFVRGATCELLKKMVLTLISFGPQNEYCFNRYASRVYGMYELHHNAVSECYETEAERLATVAGFLRDAVDVLLYDAEDVVDNLAVCVGLVNGRANCIAEFGLRYTTVVQRFGLMLGDTMKFYTEEFAASGERLGACVVSSQHKTLSSVARLHQRVETCQEMH